MLTLSLHFYSTLYLPELLWPFSYFPTMNTKIWLIGALIILDICSKLQLLISLWCVVINLCVALALRHRLYRLLLRKTLKQRNRRTKLISFLSICFVLKKQFCKKTYFIWQTVDMAYLIKPNLAETGCLIRVYLEFLVLFHVNSWNWNWQLILWFLTFGCCTPSVPNICCWWPIHIMPS